MFLELVGRGSVIKFSNSTFVSGAPTFIGSGSGLSKFLFRFRLIPVQVHAIAPGKNGLPNDLLPLVGQGNYKEIKAKKPGTPFLRLKNCGSVRFTKLFIEQPRLHRVN